MLYGVILATLLSFVPMEMSPVVFINHEKRGQRQIPLPPELGEDADTEQEEAPKFRFPDTSRAVMFESANKLFSSNENMTQWKDEPTGNFGFFKVESRYADARNIPCVSFSSAVTVQQLQQQRKFFGIACKKNNEWKIVQNWDVDK